MSQRAKDLSHRIKSFCDEVITFVEHLSDEDWSKTSPWEQWPVGVAARHLGAGHFAIFKAAGMIIRGEQLPQMTMEQVNAASDQDARAHMDCTKAEALDHLRKNSAETVAFVAGLSDAQLDSKASMPAFGGEVTAEQFLDYVLLQSGRQHLDSMQKAVAGV